MFEKLFDLIIPVAGGVFCIIYSFVLEKKMKAEKKSKGLLFAGIAVIVMSAIYLIDSIL